MAVQPHAIPAKIYVNEAHRDSDLMWQSTANLNKLVLVEETNTYQILVSVGPTVWSPIAGGGISHGGGFGFYLDDKTTAGTGQTIATHATNFTNLTVNGVGFTREISPIDLVVPMWDILTEKVMPINLEDVYVVRIQFTAANYSGAAPYIVVQMDAGGFSGAFISQTIPLLKAGDDQLVLFEFSAFVGEDWLENGGIVQIRYDGSGSVDLFNKAIQVQRTFAL